MATSLRDQASQTRPPPWRNITVLKWTAQIVALAIVVFLGLVLVGEASSNLTNRGINTSFEFLDRPPGFQIAEGIFIIPQSGWEVIIAGIVNMFRITLAGIVAATFLGTVVGIARLSSNWIVNNLATVYIEIIRNIPLLVQIVFIFAIVAALPELTIAEGVETQEGLFFVSNKGVSFGWLFWGEGFYQWLFWILLGFIAARYVHHWRSRVQDDTGRRGYAILSAIGTVLVFAIVGWYAHPAWQWLGGPIDAVSRGVGAIPPIVLQILLALTVLGITVWWIRRFLDTFRTPAGLGKLSDDDIFRIVLAAGIGLAIAGLVLLRAGISEGIIAGLSGILEWLGSKFDPLRDGAPLIPQQAGIIPPGIRPQYGARGMTMTPAFFALFAAVTLYTGAFIAEIVRAGIMAVAKGQTEAANAIGLSRSQSLRLIVLPQAFRIILPPMGNQYLNLAKNTTLGIAIAFPDLVQVGQTLFNQTGATIQVFAVWMLFYVTVSLSISAVVNWWNRRLQLVER